MRTVYRYPAAVKAAKGSKIAIGAENMHFEKSGAFTGEISADMLKELGVKYVIIGHSERRQYFNETDEACGKKVQVALENGLRPILCVGESLTEREQDVTMEVIRKQIKIALVEVLTALGVADDNVLNAQLLQHVSGDLAGESAGLLEVHVLSADSDLGALAALQQPEYR